MTLTRRQFGATTVGMAVGGAGCLTGEPGGGFGSDETGAESTDDTGENGNADTEDLSAATQQLADSLSERGLAVQSTTITDDAIRLTVQTTGDIEEDIQVAASGFATLLNSEPTIDHTLRVRVEDRGLSEGRFRIEAAWARQFVDGEINDREYLSLIANTRLD